MWLRCVRLKPSIYQQGETEGSPILPLTYNRPFTGLLEKKAGLGARPADSGFSEPLKGLVRPLKPPAPGPFGQAEPAPIRLMIQSSLSIVLSSSMLEMCTGHRQFGISLLL